MPKPKCLDTLNLKSDILLWIIKIYDETVISSIRGQKVVYKLLPLTENYVSPGKICGMSFTAN